MSRRSTSLEKAWSLIHHRAERVKTWLAAQKEARVRVSQSHCLESLEPRVLLSGNPLAFNSDDAFDLTLRIDGQGDTAVVQLVDTGAQVVASQLLVATSEVQVLTRTAGWRSWPTKSSEFFDAVAGTFFCLSLRALSIYRQQHHLGSWRSNTWHS